MEDEQREGSASFSLFWIHDPGMLKITHNMVIAT
jgi:hypothetical protein